jgi:hypothetical protein
MLRQWRSSGLSVGDFCAEREVAVATFYAWRRTIAQRDAEAVRFVPVRVVPDDQPARTAPGAVGLEVLLAGGRLIRVGPGFDAATLQRLLVVLEEARP